MTGHVAWVAEQSIAIVTIDNIARLNAIDLAIASGLAATTAELARREDINVVLLRGAGTKAFSAGVDLKAAEASGNREAAFGAIDVAMQEVERNLAAISVPTVAMLSGVCYGGGVHLASLADFRVASSNLKLAVPAIANRLFYPIPALERLAGIMGWSNTRRLIYDGGPHGAETLDRWGFLDGVTAPSEIERGALAFAKSLAEKPREIMVEYRRIFAALDRGDREAAEQLRQDAKSRELARHRSET